MGSKAHDIDESIPGYIGILEVDGSQTFVRPLEKWEKDGLPVALHFYAAPDFKGKPMVLVPREFAEFRFNRGKGRAMQGRVLKGSCEFHAIKSYVRNLFGITFSEEDDDWFQAHPLVEADGTPMAETLRVAQELIDPYGLAISRVRALPGVSIMGQLRQWQRILGINPFAMQDGWTSNRMFAEQTGLPFAEADMLFRFEFSEERMNPCVVCGVHALDGKGFPGGHAEYAAPRGSHSSALHVLQFQMQRKEAVRWNEEPVFPTLQATAASVDAEPEEEEGEHEKVVSLFLSKAPNGEEFSKLIDYSRAADETQKKASKEVVTSVTAHPKAGSKGECFVCGNPDGLLVASHVCAPCWGLTWNKYHCTKCPAHFANTPPRFMDIRKSGEEFTLVGACPSCSRVYGLKVTLGEVMTSIVKNAFYGKRPSKDDAAIIKMAYTSAMQQ